MKTIGGKKPERMLVCGPVRLPLINMSQNYIWLKPSWCRGAGLSNIYMRRWICNVYF